jgi:hypothetical protein
MQRSKSVSAAGTASEDDYLEMNQHNETWREKLSLVVCSFCLFHSDEGMW